MKCPYCLREFKVTPDATRAPYYYDGYLKDHLPAIQAGFEGGLEPGEIATALGDASFSGMISYIGKRYGWYAPPSSDLKSSYHKARLEHAWLLRCEGLKLREIGERLDLSRDRVRQMILKFGRETQRATKKTRVYPTQ